MPGLDGPRNGGLVRAEGTAEEDIFLGGVVIQPVPKLTVGQVVKDKGARRADVGAYAATYAFFIVNTNGIAFKPYAVFHRTGFDAASALRLFVKPWLTHMVDDLNHQANPSVLSFTVPPIIESLSSFFN